MSIVGKPTPLRMELGQTVETFREGPQQSKTLRSATHRPSEAAQICDTECRDLKAVKKPQKTDKKKGMAGERHQVNSKVTICEIAVDLYGRKVAVVNARDETQTVGKQKRQVSPYLLRKRSQQNFKITNGLRLAERPSDQQMAKSTSVDEPHDKLLTLSSPESLMGRSPFRKMQSSRQLCNPLSGQSKRSSKRHQSKEEHEINRLKSENEFMRTLYHRLCTAKENDRIKHAEAEQRLKRERQRLEEEVRRLREELQNAKQDKQVRIDHLFTHKLYDKQKNRVSQCIRQAASYLQESQVHPLTDQRGRTEHYRSSELLANGHRGQLQQPTLMFQPSLSRKQLLEEHERDESVQPSTEETSDSFCQLAIESAGESNVKE